jgi:hypothetical protein
MDERKPVGRIVTELLPFFKALPAAQFCFDVGHARQVDPSMTESVLLLREFGTRLAEVHISEVNTSSRHDPISTSAVAAFQSVARYIPEATPIVIESLIDEGQSGISTKFKALGKPSKLSRCSRNGSHHPALLCCRLAAVGTPR